MTLTLDSPRIDLKPIRIGDITINTPLTLAPMAGLTNYPFRSLCRDLSGEACGLVCTELLSGNAMQQKHLIEQSIAMFDWQPEEFPCAVQVFGAEPHVVAEAAQMVVDHGAQIVDINMGCWVPKVAKKGGGAALLRDVCTAAAVVEAVVKAVPATPVTVKVRSGWSPDHPTAVPFARAAADLGAKAIAVHARFAGQGFTGDADWDMIRQVKEAVGDDIPVLGNGDVLDARDAARMLALTGCDGVMIGRGAMGNPWLFRQIAHELATGERLPEPTPAERAEAAVTLARRTLATSKLHPRRVILELRGQLLKFADRLPDPEPVRAAVKRGESLEDYEAAFAPLLAG